MRNPVKTAKRQLLRVGSCALSALMVLGSIRRPLSVTV